MNRPELYEWSVDTLIDAYNNGHLYNMRCGACAVGNLIARKNNYKIVIMNHGPFVDACWISNDDRDPRARAWNKALHHDVYPEMEDSFLSEGEQMLDSIGYTREEIKRIEIAFERYRIRIKESLFAVLAELAKIHEAEEEQVEETKNKIYERREACLA